MDYPNCAKIPPVFLSLRIEFPSAFYHITILPRFDIQALTYCQMGSVGLIEYPSAAK